MNKLVNRIMGELKNGEIDDLWVLGDLVRRFYQSSFTSGFPEIDREKITISDADMIKDGVLRKLAESPSSNFRTQLVNVLSHFPDPSLIEIINNQLHWCVSQFDLNQGDGILLSTCLNALENHGLKVLFESGKTGYGSDEVEFNLGKARRYLEKK